MMNADSVCTHVAPDGSRQVFRKGTGDEGPRPIDDEELDAVAGGINYRVAFNDGCQITVNQVDNMMQAADEAVQIHEQFFGHDCNSYQIESL